MRAWEVHNRVLSLHDVPTTPVSNGEATIQLTHTGICGSDLPKLAHPGRFDLPERWRPGHEMVGRDRSGRAVAVDPLIPCNQCLQCTRGRVHLCRDLERLGWDRPGGFADTVVAPLANLHPLPAGLDSCHAVLADPAAVAIHALRCHPTGTIGELAVIGLGPLGFLTALYAHRLGWAVTMIHRPGSEPSTRLAEAVPAAFRSTMNPRPGSGYDVVIDAAAGVDASPLELALRLVADGGSIIVLTAYHPKVRFPMALRDTFRRSVSITGSFSFCRQVDIGDFADGLIFLRETADILPLLVEPVGELASLHAALAPTRRTTAKKVLTFGAGIS